MSTKNFEGAEAREKLAKLAKDIDFCMMITKLEDRPLNAIPMSTKDVDDQAAIWFLSRKDSEHNSNIRSDKNVQLLYSDTSDLEFVSIYGEAFIETNREVIKELYSKADNAWFDGEDDPNITAIRVVPKEGYYWDNKHNKMITFIKMAQAAVSGDNQDISEKGKLNV